MGRDRAAVDEEIRECYAAIAAQRERIAALRKERPPEAVKDYAFREGAGTVRLTGLFGKRKDLVVVHNMGKTCPMCTLWADAFNGILPHLEDRFAFVVSSPDRPDAQRAFAASRGWRFRMVSTEGTGFARDMGYEKDGKPWPGVSVFQVRDGEPVRAGHAEFGPGDEFSPMFGLMRLLPEGQAGWWPKFQYEGR